MQASVEMPAPAAEQPVPVEVQAAPATIPTDVAPVQASAAVEIPVPAVEQPAPIEAQAAPTPNEATPIQESPVVEPPAPVEARAEAPPAVPEPAVAAAAPPHVEIPILSAEPEPLPDPLLALAEQIRAAQRAVSEPEPPPALPRAAETPGLPALATAIGLVEAPTVEPELAPASAAPAAAAPAEPQPAKSVEAGAHESNPQPVALLAPPVESPAQIQQSEIQQPEIQQPEPQQIEAPQALSLIQTAPVPEPPPIPAVPGVKAAEPEVTAPPIEVLPPPVVKDLVTPPPPPPSVDRPPSGSWLQLAPLQNFSSAANKIQPVAPPVQILTPDSGPRMTLPGPALPPKLERLQDAGPVTVIGDEARPKRGGMPGWLVSLLLMISIPIAGAGVLFYFQPIGHSSADAKQAAPEPQPAAPQGSSHPLSQFVEVTGFRIVVDYNKKSEIHYLLVNHSGADLSDMTIFVTLRTANAKPGQPPLCRFSFKAPSLGPFESKEMMSPIEKLSRSISLPDWQDLKAEVQVSQ